MGEYHENDLYIALSPDLERYQLPQNVHFKKTGNIFLSEKVPQAIEEVLEQDK